ncbi:MAG: hypothetical protein M0Z43_05760 [Acidithiobacillus sp.]|jgi:Skp family chaperone for outer membrane proteins|nr:hypothetical protein [Acidithiobacillus sp.]
MDENSDITAFVLLLLFFAVAGLFLFTGNEKPQNNPALATVMYRRSLSAEQQGHPGRALHELMQAIRHDPQAKGLGGLKRVDGYYAHLKSAVIEKALTEKKKRETEIKQEGRAGYFLNHTSATRFAFDIFSTVALAFFLGKLYRKHKSGF